MSFKVTDFGTNRKPTRYFPLVINNKLHTPSRTISKLSQIIVEILEEKRPLFVFELPLKGVGA